MRIQHPSLSLAPAPQFGLYLISSQDPAVTWLTSPRFLVLGSVSSSVSARGSPVFLTCVKLQERGGWLASKKRNSLFSLHCGKGRTRRPRLFSLVVCLKIWGS